MGKLSDSDIIKKFMDDVDKIRQDKDICFYNLEEETALALCECLESDPLTSFLTGIDWKKEPIFPMTRSAAMYIYKCIHAKSR